MIKCKKCRDWGLLTARILIGLLFLVAAYSKFTGMDGTVGYIAGNGVPWPTVMAWVGIVVELLGGMMLISGLHPNGAAAILSLYVLIITFIFHFDLGDASQTIQLVKNLAIVGGLLAIVFGGSGRLKLLKCKCCSDCVSCKAK